MAGERQYSFQTGEKNTFGVIDYILFAALLCISAGIGLFYAIKDRKKTNTKEFLLAGGNMSAVPVGLSLLASFMSAITLLGTPAEMYNYTTIYWWIGLGYFFVILAATTIYIPIFYRLRVTSSYEVTKICYRLYTLLKRCTLKASLRLTGHGSIAYEVQYLTTIVHDSFRCDSVRVRRSYTIVIKYYTSQAKLHVQSVSVRWSEMFCVHRFSSVFIVANVSYWDKRFFYN